MKSGFAPAATTVKAISNGECVDRILTIVRRLQEQIRDQEADFQSRLQRASEETEQRLEEQYRTLKEQAVAEAQEKTREKVTDALLSRFDLEISELRASFDRRLHDVMAENEALEQLKIESAVAEARETVQQQMQEEARNMYQAKLNDAERLIDQLKEETKTCANEWRAERQQFQERIAMLERTLDTATAVRTEKLDDYKEMERKLEEALQLKEQLQLDLQRAVSELNSHAQSVVKEEPVHAVHGEVAAMVQAEMVRVRLHLDEIEKTLADPAIDLGSEIRLNRERGEIQAYLKGLRYSLGEVTLQSSAVEDPCRT